MSRYLGTRRERMRFWRGEYVGRIDEDTFYVKASGITLAGMTRPGPSSFDRKGS